MQLSVTQYAKMSHPFVSLKSGHENDGFKQRRALDCLVHQFFSRHVVLHCTAAAFSEGN